MSVEPDRRRRQISDLYHAALSQSPGERAAFLEQVCGGDTALRQEVESLLQYEPATSRFLEAPAAVMAGVSDVPGTSMVGRELGPYRLLAPLGAGGMGEVYRARDSKLGRDVAIKILPAFFSADPERRARFAREARLLATLNHPHIGAIYGLEETDGATALVLELIEGPTLADRLGRGSLALSEALAIARQVAEALEAAHEHRIIHRDLKPANVVLQGQRADVRVKVLDFGLAKFVHSHEDQAATATAMARTEDGRILGTPAYMSPEQARGEAVDRRTDIWAFGCVLFEMLSGRRAFEGQTIPDTLAHVLERDPDWSALPATTPTALRSLLERCLRKEPRKRLHDIADARIELEERMLPGGSSASALAAPVERDGRKRLAWGVGAILAMVAVAATTLPYWRNTPGGGPELIVFPIAPAENSRFIGTSPEFAISPNGRQVAFVASSNRGSKLWVRSIDAVEIRPLDGTDGARNPFWSPDSQSVGYFAGDKLKIIRVNGGSPVDLSPVGNTARSCGP